ncbi:T-cell activation inhibitor, mitochondrial isoform X3 [Pseudonaja textilis]|uniref:T-cell activation inhibitor, mitochondrial isoform X3 n=1 Tax=Pseudonaja textilis TaxID=8673 RepID=UPI000EA8FD12|nr:T-cell activation inhibitor, mitochondrial isoform X3 [Pseudonaja textilis]
MFCHWLTIRRLCFKKLQLQARALSGADAINALRPFYFAVHPDFFGQHPREREINENSLKRLNGYLENLQKPGFRSFKPTRLTFYVREREQSPSSVQEPFGAAGFRAVSFTLHTRDLLSTVLDILNSCSLSTDHVQSLNGNVNTQSKQETKRMFHRPIKWDKTYYSFTGFKDPEEELEQAQRMETTLRWQRSWGIAHRCSQLHSLSRLAHQSPEVPKNAKGQTVIFTDRSGMNATGYVMLGTMDVHHHWTKIFERLPSYSTLQKKVLFLEERISELLGGIQITHVEELQPMLTIEEYYSILDNFYDQVHNKRLPFHPNSLRGLQMILGSDRYAPSLHELGHFIIPVMCDLVTLQWFIMDKTQQAREKLKRKEESILLEKKLIKAATKNFCLQQLYKEPSVSSAQMIHSCSNLLEESLPYLQGMHLCISHFFSVLQDGDLCIPWNWKN